ncbi:uncharacterized protein G2W53_024565 [Senna tora]|uniref:Uncharacterized protein n=1 Tax=Senna tora TaxID=362788 RepID=A0A834WD83_9FABA|nr:uncharacterized protein G2W53_024565 [Senna tora]
MASGDYIYRHSQSRNIGKVKPSSSLP